MYIQSCPVGCHDFGTVSTDIQRPEGLLFQCVECGQLMSQCTEKAYVDSMQEFNVSEGTLPNQQSIQRAGKLHSSRLNLIQQALKMPNNKIKLLDVGCSSGSFLNTAKKSGFNTYGIEPAEKAAKTASINGHKITIGYLDNKSYSENYFDAITLFEVIEHLKDPITLLRDMHRVLKPGGVVMISTGNANSWTVRVLKEKWDYFSLQQHGGHISFFNPKSISMLVTKADFSVHRLITRNVKFANKGSGSRIQYRLLKILSEILSPLAKYFGRGHDMILILKKANQT